MAGVLSRSATHLAAAATAATARPASIFLTVTRRPSAFASPSAAVPRFIHTEVKATQLTPEVKAEIERVVRETLQAETIGTKAEIGRVVRETLRAETIGIKAACLQEANGIRAACLERYEKLSFKQIAQGELADSRHAEATIRSIQRDTRFGMRVCFSMLGLAAAYPYLCDLFGGGPPSEEEVDKMVHDKVQAYTDNVVRDVLPREVRVVCAQHFVEEQRLKDLHKKE